MPSFVTFFYNQGGTCPKSQTKNGGSWLSGISAKFRKNPGIFDRIRACRTLEQLRTISFSKVPFHQLAKAERRVYRQAREIVQRHDHSVLAVLS